MDQILKIDNRESEKFLRRKTVDFDWKKFSKKEIRELLKKMRRVMKEAQGIGLSGNQIGLNLNVFVAEVENKFYAIFNPKIEKKSTEIADLEEGCLSVPRKYGLVPRSEKITLSGYDHNQKKIKIKAWGLLARVFQHEIDHLHGALFIDRAKYIEENPTSERLTEREKKVKK